jgi:hypothetical protein
MSEVRAIQDRNALGTLNASRRLPSGYRYDGKTPGEWISNRRDFTQR